MPNANIASRALFGSFCIDRVRLRMGVFVLVLLSDVVGVEVSFYHRLCPSMTMVCALLCVWELSPSTERFHRYALKNEKASFLSFGGGSVKALGSHGGDGWELRRLNSIFILSTV